MSFICFAISSNFNSAVNLVAPFSRQKALKSKNKKHSIFWNTKFYHPAKFELKRIKNANLSIYYIAIFGVLYALLEETKKTCMLNIIHLMSDPEGNSFVFPRVLMFSETNSRETSGLTLGFTGLLQTRSQY